MSWWVWLILGPFIVSIYLWLLWWGKRVDEERRSEPRKTSVRINSYISGPIGAGVYKASDDRLKTHSSSEGQGEDETR
jgi:hypothetical protein